MRAQLKMAIAKAAFNYLSGEWGQRYFFYDEGGKLTVEGSKEKEICQIYEQDSKTKLVLFKDAHSKVL